MKVTSVVGRTKSIRCAHKYFAGLGLHSSH